MLLLVCVVLLLWVLLGALLVWVQENATSFSLSSSLGSTRT